MKSNFKGFRVTYIGGGIGGQEQRTGFISSVICGKSESKALSLLRSGDMVLKVLKIEAEVPNGNVEMHKS